MPTSTPDEDIVRADAAIETAIGTLRAANNSMDRVAALRLLVKRINRKNTQRLMRPVTSAIVP